MTYPALAVEPTRVYGQARGMSCRRSTIWAWRNPRAPIRAQLADALVAVVCQRLEYLAPLQLRVPKCEVLFGSPAAKATIRSGQMSQIANVILSGGDEGMWTLDRYQRWMEQKSDWVRPGARPAAVAEKSKVVSAPDSPIEITIDEDVDLKEIAELARRIEERTK